jgi:hypothetical protein
MSAGMSLSIPSTYLELWKAFLISKDSSMMASYSDWREVNKAGIEVWFAGLGGRVDGSVYERCS